MREEIRDSIPPEYGPGVGEYFAVALKHAWLIVIVVLASAVGGWFYASAQPPVYEATSRLVIDTQSHNILSDVAPVVDMGGQSYWAIREYLETQYRILGSASVAGEVATRLGLDQDTAFLGLDEIEDPILLEQALEVANPAAAVLSRVSVEPVDDSRVVAIRARASDAVTAAALANTMAEVYIERNLERRLESTNSAATWLAAQYESLSESLRASERALVDFRQQHDLIAVELSEHVSLMSRMEETSRQLAQARLEADQARSVVEQIDAARESGDVFDVDITAIVENELIQALKAELYSIQSERLALSARYLDQHPEMVALAEREMLAQGRLSNEIANVLGAYRQQSARAAQLVGTLESRLEATEADVQALGTHQVEYAALVRNVEANRQLFELIERRLKEVEITRNSQHNNVEQLEVAMPPLTPVAPNRLVLVGAATGGGMLLALLLAFLREAMDNTVRGQDALEREFGLTFLGLIPRIRPSVARVSSPRGPARGEAWSADTYAHDYPKSAIAESCRAIRTNLAFVLADGGLDTLLVTSPGPREGKTTTCVNIASVMAQAGGRVLLVDADMRRPRVHTAVGVQNDVGLTSVLLDGLSVGEAVQPSRIPNLDVLTSGPVPPNPAELLGSKAFRELLEELRGRYDRVILDSPPVAPVTDAAVAATQVSGVVVVVRANATRKELLGRAIETLQGVGANLVGAVLNDLDLSRRRAGGSYYYYYRQYSGYYGPGADES